jgi:catechol 2,3-dioxygenase-like lactoylglutathione lyase family enzyme
MTSDPIHFSLGWVIVYVDAPAETARFYESTFGLTLEFAVPDGSYAQLDTGATKLAFASYALGEKNFEGGVRRAAPTGQPPNVEIAQALAGGCSTLSEPEDKPQGQRVAYVRDPFGTLVELATPL